MLLHPRAGRACFARWSPGSDGAGVCSVLQGREGTLWGFGQRRALRVAFGESTMLLDTDRSLGSGFEVPGGNPLHAGGPPSVCVLWWRVMLGGRWLVTFHKGLCCLLPRWRLGFAGNWSSGVHLGLVRWDAAVMEVSYLTRTRRCYQVIKGVQSPWGLMGSHGVFQASQLALGPGSAIACPVPMPSATAGVGRMSSAGLGRRLFEAVWKGRC